MRPGSGRKPSRTLVHGAILMLIGLVVIGGEGASRIDLITVLGIVTLSLGVTLTAGPALLAHTLAQRLIGALAAALALAVAVGTTYLTIGPVILGTLLVMALAVSVVASLSARTD